jgi:hypothetical protein
VHFPALLKHGFVGFLGKISTSGRERDGDVSSSTAEVGS